MIYICGNNPQKEVPHVGLFYQSSSTCLVQVGHEGRGVFTLETLFIVVLRPSNICRHIRMGTDL